MIGGREKVKTEVTNGMKKQQLDARSLTYRSTVREKIKAEITNGMKNKSTT